MPIFKSVNENGEEIELDLPFASKEEAESHFSEYATLSKKDFDYKGLENKTKNKITEAEQKLIDEGKKRIEVETRLSSIEKERTKEYVELEASKYVDLDSKEDVEKFIKEMGRIDLTEEEKSLSIREQMRIKATYAAKLLEITPSALSKTYTSGRTVTQKDKKEESFADTDQGSVLLDKLLTPAEKAILKKMREDGRV